MKKANPYLSTSNNANEQALLDDLWREAISIHGYNAVYLVRDSGTIDSFHGEDPRAQFNKWFEICVFIQNVEGFGGASDRIFPFGMSFEQTITLQVSKTDFNDAIGFEIEPNRPREGDLLYFPYGITENYLLEVKRVTDQIPFNQLGQQYVYTIECRMFTSSNEDITVGLPEVDEIGSALKQEIEVQWFTGSGTFVEGEVVFQGTSFATATFKAVIKKVLPDTQKMLLSNFSGVLNASVVLKGNTSGASRSIAGDQRDLSNDPASQNKLIADQASPIIIKNPKNPFDKGRL